MQFQCKACGASFPAIEWNIATRKHKSKHKEFIPIQKIYDRPNDPSNKNLKWFCPSCSIDKPDVQVKVDET